LEQLASALATFIDRGLPVSQKAILDKFGLSVPIAGEAVLHPAPKPADSRQEKPAER
jgi:hypothetical protein